MIPTAQDVLAAQARIAPHIVRTPLLRSAVLDQAVGRTVLIKPECLQRTGSFKLRGATNALRRLVETGGARAVVAYSSGNHAQGVACAAAALGMRATIVMPADAPAIKRELTAFWGATIVPYDRATENREAIAGEIAARTGAALIPPYEHPDVIAGQGTAALEVAADAAALGLTVEAMIVCTGGGGFLAGCALGMEAASPATKMYAAEPAGWDDTARSLAAGERLANDGRGSPFCDAILTPMPGELTFSINRRLVTAGLVANDDEVRAAQAFAARHLKLVVEPGGAVALASVLAGRAPAGAVIALTLSGGNAD
jgi:threonine dehydratase